MFDEIDATYYRLRAAEEREKAHGAGSTAAARYRDRADTYEKKALALLQPEAVAPQSQR